MRTAESIERHREGQRRRNPQLNEISRAAYKLAGGFRAFYSLLDKDERIATRALARRHLEGTGLVLQFPWVERPAASPRKVTTTVMTRPGADKFRRKVLARDGGCVITGVPVGTFLYSKGRRKSVLEAAHIVPFSMCAGDEYNDPHNGLTMTTGMHAEYDAALFTISSSGRILPSRWVDADRYPPFCVTPLRITGQMREYLARHHKWAMKNWNRWAFT